MMAVALVINPLPGAGFGTRAAAWLRRIISRRALLRLAGVDSVILQGRLCPLRPVPLGIARDLVPAIVRCSRRFASAEIDEALYDDLVQVLSLGLQVPSQDIERLTIALWDLAPVVDRIARVNGLPVLEAGSAGLGELITALTKSTGTSTSPGSSAPQAGPGNTSPTT